MKRNILITGGGKGFGKHIAKVFAEAGENILISGRDEAALLQTQKELKNLPGVIRIHKADISKPEEAAALADTAIKHFGIINLLVLNAGTYLEKSTDETSTDEWNYIINTNLTANFIIINKMLPVMKKSGGRIIGISSVGGRIGLSGKSAYCASKFGFTGFLKALAKEIKKDNIAVNIVYPYFIDSHLKLWKESEEKSTGSSSENSSEKSPEAKSAGEILTIKNPREILNACHPDDGAKVIKFLADLPLSIEIEDVNLDPFIKK